MLGRGSTPCGWHLTIVELHGEGLASLLIGDYFDDNAGSTEWVLDLGSDLEICGVGKAGQLFCQSFFSWCS